MSEVRAQASVDVGSFPLRDRVRDQAFVVTVTGYLDPGQEPLPKRRYEIEADSEVNAAFEGLARYEREMQRPN